MKQERKEEQECANCCHRLNTFHQTDRRSRRGPRKKEEEEDAVIVHEIKIIDPHGSSSSSSTTVSVHKAISSLYNLQLLNELPAALLHEFEDELDDAEENDHHHKNGKGLMDFVLCQKCAPMLTQFYNLSLEFRNLGRADSYLWKCVDKLNRIMSMVQTTWAEMMVQQGEEPTHEEEQEQVVVLTKNDENDSCHLVNRESRSLTDEIMMKKYYTDTSLRIDQQQTEEDYGETKEKEEMAEEENCEPITTTTTFVQPQHIDLVPLVPLNRQGTAEDILTTAFQQAENLILAMRTARMKNNDDADRKVQQKNVDPLYKDDDQDSPLTSLNDENFDDADDDHISDNNMEIVDQESSGDENVPTDLDPLDLNEYNNSASSSFAAVHTTKSDPLKVDIDKEDIPCDNDKKDQKGYMMRPRRRRKLEMMEETRLITVDDDETIQDSTIDDNSNNSTDNDDDEFQVNQDDDDEEEDDDFDEKYKPTPVHKAKLADGTESELFECDKCHRQFRHARNIRSHQKVCGSGKYKSTKARKKRSENWGSGVGGRRDYFSLLYSGADNENRKRTRSLPYNCTLCENEGGGGEGGGGERFNQKTELSRHWIRNHTPHDWDNIKIEDYKSISFKVTCPICIHQKSKMESDGSSNNGPLSFTNLKLLQAHLFQHVDEVYKTCPKCNHVVKRVSDLARHVRNCFTGKYPVATNDSSRPYKCPQCPKGFKTSGHVFVHIARTHKEKTVPCSKCDRKFARRADMLMHEQWCGSEKKRPVGPLQCPNCPKQYAAKISLQDHLNYHNGVTLNCPRCEKTFLTTRSLKLHVQEHERVDGGLPARHHICEECGNGYSNKKMLNEHMTIHTGEKKYLCPICGGRFRSRCVFRIHMMTHGTEKKYKCPTCFKCYKRPDVLKIHMKSHLGKSFLCQVCGAGFSLQWTLKLHQRQRHEGQKPYECEDCGKAFGQRSTCTAHRNAIHLEKKFSCEVCDKSFVSKAYAKRHMMLHTAEALGNKKRFNCPFCKSRFSNNENRNRHVKMKHPGKKIEIVMARNGDDD